MEEYWGLSLDDLAEAIYSDLKTDAIGGHYAAFSGDRATAREKMIAAFAALIDKKLYRASSYGSQWTEEDNEDPAWDDGIGNML